MILITFIWSLWDKDALEIVGAYRFADAAKLSQAQHKTGLYSATLFDYNEHMQPYFSQGLELGRSFVQPQYWGKRSLDYLMGWDRCIHS